ncbi:MAG: formate dehydrogenase accessory sulfurtransferase FdhD [Syntrophaceae bacterium]
MAIKAEIERFDICTYRDNKCMKTSADIVNEVSLEIFLNGQRVITIACNGNYMEDLAVGFLRSEGIIRAPSDILEVEISEERNTVSVYTKSEIHIPSNEPYEAKTIASSGARSWERDMDLSRQNLLENRTCISPESIFALVQNLIDSSRLHGVTGGTHSAALVHGEHIIVLREDIGRHNAIDMLGGYALIKGIDCSDKIIVRTGRISLEIVNKVWNLGIPILISLSVPTTAAIHAALEAGITMIGSVRDGKMNVYCNEWRVFV